MVMKAAPAALACSTKSFQPSDVFLFKEDGGDLFGDVAGEAADARGRR